jgi:hypothetical protein
MARDFRGRGCRESATVARLLIRAMPRDMRKQVVSVISATSFRRATENRSLWPIESQLVNTLIRVLQEIDARISMLWK